MIKVLLSNISKEAESLFYWIPVAIGLGIIFFFQLPFDPDPNIAIAATISTILITYLLRKFYIPYTIALAILFFVLGYSAAQYRAISLDAPKIKEKIEDIWIEANISEITYFDNGRRLILENIDSDDLLSYETPLKIRVNTRSDVSSFQIGDRVLLKASLMPPPEPMIPNGFDFSYYLYFKQIGAIGFAKSRIILLDENTKNSFENYVNKLRKAIADRISSQIENPFAAIANGMMVGDASQINKDDFDIIRVSGIAHIIAISGMHIVCVVGMVFFATRFLLTRFSDFALRYNVKKVSALIAIIFSFIYLLISGSPVSAQRAFVMSSLVLSAIVFDRNSTPMRSIAISAIIILLITPEALMGASLQMSFAACVALIASYEVSTKFFAHKFGRSFIAKSTIYITSVTFSTLVAGAATAPFIIYHFNQFSTYSILANILCVPLSDFFIMPFGMISMLLMPVGLDFITLKPMEWGLIAMFNYAKYISELPNASFFIPSFTSYGMSFVIVGGLVLCFLSTRLRYAGLIAIVIGFTTLKDVRKPDIAIDKSGKFFVIKDEKDNLYFSAKRIPKFAKGAWMQNLGINDFQTINELNSCDENSCYISNANSKSAYVVFGEVQHQCKDADVVLNLSNQEYKCSNSKVIKKADLIEKGGHLIWLLKDGIKIKTVLENRPKRIWNG